MHPHSTQQGAPGRSPIILNRDDMKQSSQEQLPSPAMPRNTRPERQSPQIYEAVSPSSSEHIYIIHIYI